jgi:outer membrane biosynthesis protein TonB
MQGTSSIEMLPPIASPQAGTDKSGEVSANIVINDIPPSAIGELARPAYPAAALAAGAGSCVVYATITIDARGRVTEVVPSWQRLNVPNRYSDEFLEAVKAAVRGWRFEPARVVTWEKTGNDDLKYLGTETIPVRTDVKFTFEASGAVR